MQAYNLITTQRELVQFCEHLSEQAWITVDTEFLREKMYRPKLCLIQIATTEQTACIDPQVLDDMTDLVHVLHNPNILKVLHAAHQDLEIFYMATGQAPAPIFDTQIAASVLGYGDQMGYARLVEAIKGISLNKSQSRTDWSSRPLSDKQLEYAIADVTHLREVYLHLQNELEQKGRSNWLSDEFAALSDNQQYEPKFDQLWKKIRQHQRLSAKQLNNLSHLCIWREQLAIKSNRPRRWIASDDILMDIAKIQPESKAEMGKIRGIEQGFLSKHGDTLLNLIQTAHAIPQSEWPRLKKPIKLNTNQENMLDYLMLAAKLQSQQHDITLNRLVNRKELEQLIHGERDLPLLKGWRKRLVGDALLKLLNNETNLIWQKNELIIKPTE